MSEESGNSRLIARLVLLVLLLLGIIGAGLVSTGTLF